MFTTFEVEGDNTATMTNMEAGIAQEVQPSEPYARKLWVVGCATLAADIGAWFHQPAAGSILGHHENAYYGILAGVLGAVALEMATALWLTRSGDPRVRAFAKGLLPLAVLLLLAVLGGFGTSLAVKP